MTHDPQNSIVIAPHPTWSQRLVQVGASVALMLGILGLLRTGFDGIDQPTGEDLFTFPTHPITALAHLGVGFVGISATTTPARARLFGAAAGAMMLSWVLLGLLLDGDPNVVFSADRRLLAVNLGLGVVFALAAVLPGETGADRRHRREALDRPAPRGIRRRADRDRQSVEPGS